ncbi:reducing type I polyketide synthase [Chaetomium sp. MPI-CAGE-AT-0009]|nr:reducing type I polyketide synthase [Chaetomium sp. MPI-CAGE-AT-0009]
MSPAEIANGVSPTPHVNGVNGVQKPKTEPLAIVGMACRFAGGITSPEKLWELVSEGRDAWSEVPDHRFNQKAFYHPDSQRLSTMSMQGGFFLQQDPGVFDCSFFNLTADAAASMDPQIRIQLELTFEALESAGIPLSKAVGSNTSVYTGSFTKDYHDLQARDPLHASRGFVTGNYAAMLANRVSHFFDLRGPSTAVDTGCSTSLMALHLACQSLRAGESDCAIVGGASLHLNPDAFTNLSALQTCGPHGKCYAFDHRAQGYGRGDGIAAVVVKRLSDAIRDGDPIRAVVRESAVNQDGRTPTITAPSEDAQRRLIEHCYAIAGLDPLETSVVEAHGTGTKVGDPAEARAIGEALGRHRAAAGVPPLYVASVKTNLGHTEAASGLAGLIKLVMSLEHRHIPASLNFEKANPAIDMEALQIKVPTMLEPWETDGVRRASLNNFGYGGTNTHVIIEEAAGHVPEPQTNGVNVGINRQLFILSARDKAGVGKAAANLRQYLAQRPETPLTNLAYTLAERRSRFPWTWSTSAATTSELMAALADDTTTNQPIQTTTNNGPPRLGFVFNGQGAQWHAMGRELAAAYPVYAQTLVECDRAIRSFGCAWSLVDELSRDEAASRVHDVQMSMPMSCAVQIALVELLRFLGVRPAAVTGHSSGEVAAAYAAGVISLREAMACTYFRGLVNAQHLAKQGEGSMGTMMAVGLGPAEAQVYLDKLDGPAKVVIACVNSPSSVTLSGDVCGIQALEAEFVAQRIFARRLRVQAAFHSHHMLPLEEKYRAALEEHMDTEGERAFAPGVRFVSPVTGDVVEDADGLGPGHWVDNMTQPVLFAQSFQAMVATGDQQQVDMVVEVGPHSALAGPIRQTLRGVPAIKSFAVGYGSCLERGTDAVRTIQTLAGALVSRGYPVNTLLVNAPRGQEGLRALAGLPSYPWNHSQRFWHESRESHEHRFRTHPAHDLLGARLEGTSDGSPIWRHILRTGELPWVRDHIVQGDTVYPAAGFIAMAIEAVRQLHSSEAGSISGYQLGEVEILKALVIPEGEKGVEVQLFLEAPNEKTLAQGKRVFRIYSAPAGAEGTWSEMARGTIAVEKTATPLPLLRSTSSIDFDEAAYHKNMAPKALYDVLHAVGVRHGPSFQKLLDIRRGGEESKSTLEVCDSAALMPCRHQQPHVIHPITLDNVFQAAYTALSPGAREAVGAALPTSIKSLYVSSAISSEPGHRFEAFSRVLQRHRLGFNVALAVLEPGQSKPLIEVDTMGFTTVGGTGGGSDNGSSEADTALEAASKICSFIDWEPSVTLNDANAQWAERLKRPADPVEKVLAKDLTRAGYYLIADATAQLTEDDIANLERHHQSMWAWMQLQLERAAANELAPDSADWAGTPADEQSTFLDGVAEASTNGALAVRVGRNLLRILRREVAPLEVMLEGGLLYKFYQDMLRFKASTAQLAEVVGALARENPRLRILEIGGGTGGCTRPVLDHLRTLSDGGVNAAGFEHYTFTDISSGFFQAARERFAEWGDLISYTALNIEEDAAEQGFSEKSYDVIIAAQVLHATKNMAVTMRNVRKLLKDDGKLLMIETTKDSIDVQMAFGTLPGWWLSEEPERKYSPNMPLAMWEPYLRDAGFSGLDLSVWDCEDEEHQTMNVIMSTAVPETAPVYSDQVALVYDKTAPPPEGWLEGLASAIANTTGTTPSVTDLAELDVDNKVAIFISGLDGAAQNYLDDSYFESIKAILLNVRGLLWVTTGSAIDCPQPENALHTGFLRTCRVEDGSRRLVSLDLDPARKHFESPSLTHATITKVFATAFNTATDNNPTAPNDWEFAERAGTILLPRLRRDAAQSAAYTNTPGEPELQPFLQPGPNPRQLKLEVSKPGLLDSLVFRDDPDANAALPADWVEVEARAYGVNFRDVMVAMGQMDGEEDLGVGMRVAALTARGGIASRVGVPWTSVVRMPDDMGFADGASLCAVFSTAYYSMFEAARLEPGETMLVHAASGGVGQACIILAQWKGIEVYATVGTPEKRRFLTETYGIPEDRIFNSRDVSFGREVMAATKQRGVDVVINSLAGALLHESWGVLAAHGRFIEIGKKDIYNNMSLDMATFRKAASFIAVDLVQLCSNRGRVVHRVLKAVMDLLEAKTIRNISPIVTYPMSAISRALRTMQAGRHMGKIVVVPEADDMVKTIPSRPKATLSPDASYLIIGGLGGIGRSIARWAVERGARNLILISRHAADSPHSQALQDELARQGATVAARNCDASDLGSLSAALADCAHRHGMPAVRGVIHGGMVLDDSILERMTAAQWRAALRPKVAATQNILALFPAADALDFLILLSSAVGVLGSASQANYAAGGSFQDAVARRRAAAGLPCVAIDLGMVDGVGYVADSDASVAARLVAAGHRPLSEADMLRLIDYAVRQPVRGVSVRTAQVVVGIAGSVLNKNGSGSGPGWARETRFAALRDDGDDARDPAAARKGGSGLGGLRERLAGARGFDEAAGLVEGALVGKLADMFVIPEQDIDATRPLAKHGVDSLVAVELRNWIVPMMQCEMSIFDLLRASSLRELAKKIAKRSKLVSSIDGRSRGNTVVSSNI